MPGLPARRPEAGFVLVGVVLFVLALTILVFSLYGLSSYEAQFLQHSLDGEQAFQSAVGGIERAKFTLCRTSLLQSVAANLPLENVVAATAVQVQDGNPVSTGTVRWGPNERVSLQVTARVNGQERTVAGDFVPLDTQDYYSNLVTVSDRGIEIEANGPGGLQDGTVQMIGPVWDGSGEDPSVWESHLMLPWPPVQLSPLVQPSQVDISTFFSQHLGGATFVAPQIVGPSSSKYVLDASGSAAPQYFVTTGYDPNSPPHYSLDDVSSSCVVQVAGFAVWLFPQGVRFDYLPIIQPLPGSVGAACLVIVAGQSNGDPTNTSADAGVYFEGGINSTIPLVLVSDHRILIQDWQSYNTDGSAGELSIVARGAYFLGPWSGHGNKLYLAHPAGGLLDSYLPLLESYHALPNSANPHTLSLVSGTWHTTSQ